MSFKLYFSYVLFGKISNHAYKFSNVVGLKKYKLAKILFNDKTLLKIGEKDEYRM